METDSNNGSSFPHIDPLDETVIWTPEIERLAQTVARWIRLDTPGGVVFGKQRNGKSSACEYLTAVLTSIIGYPIATVSWSIPSNHSPREREFTQERLLQSRCGAIAHRDVAVLRGRLLEHIAQLADSLCARRVIVVIDEAQNLEPEHYGYLVHCFNELVQRQLRPFFLLIGQPELENARNTWEKSRSHQIVGRFHVNKHVFRGIAAADMGEVLSEFDKPSPPESISPVARVLPAAYAAGWSLAKLEPVLREALELAKALHNLTGEVRIPMQYLRSSVLAFLYWAIETRMNPADASSALLLRCLRDSGFLSVITYYIEAEENDKESD
jgi:hypothetical protein